MPEDGRYKKMPRPESIKFFIDSVPVNRFVQSVTQLGPQLFLVTREGKSNITVFLTNIYIVGEADVIDILANNGKVDCIVTISNWNSYTNDAKELAKSHSVGLFVYKEFLGALNYDRKKFINYEPPKRDEGSLPNVRG